MVTVSKLCSTPNQCGHVDKMSTGGLSVKKPETYPDQVYIDKLTKYPFLYKGRSFPRHPVWTFCPHFVHIFPPQTHTQRTGITP